MKTVRAVVVAIGVIAGGCATLLQPPAAPETFQHAASSAHIELYWTCSEPEAGRLRVNGVARNRGHAQEIRFVELELVGVNGGERTVSEARAALPAILLHTNEVSPFRLELHPAGTEVRYDLYYQYLANEGKAISAFGSIPAPLLAQQNQRFIVRDACGLHQH